MAWVGTPENIGRAGLDDAVEHARCIERRMRDELTAADNGNGHADDHRYYGSAD